VVLRQGLHFKAAAMASRWQRVVEGLTSAKFEPPAQEAVVVLISSIIGRRFKKN